MSPITQRRLANFRRNRRGYWSLIIFTTLFLLSCFAELLCNDRPLLVKADDGYYFPLWHEYSELEFGGEFDQLMDYQDPYFAELIESQSGYAVWPPIRFNYDTINYNLPQPAPSPPTATNLLGTDDRGRDVLVRLVHGFRTSVLFALTLTVLSSIIGIAAGAVQGYYGGRVDLFFQRFIEIWSGLPMLFLLIILSSLVEPNFWWLLGIMLLFSWMNLVDVVRAEFLRCRNLEYVRAAQALGLSSFAIMSKHILPNAMVATLTFIPFLFSSAVVTLTALDFLGFGLPPGTPSLGELVAQGKENLHAPWLGLTAFVVLSVMLTLLIFIGEAVRDAFDPRRSNG